MNKILSTLSLSFLFSTSALAADYIVSEPRALLPNEDIKSFTMADLNGDGIDELVFVDSSGQLKYSQLIGLGHGLISADEFQRFNSSRKLYNMNISVNGDTLRNTKVEVSGYGEIALLRDGRYRACAASMNLQSNEVVATRYSDVKYQLTYISNDFIAGKMMCARNGIAQLEEVTFTAQRVLY
ncbi:hypothetical protein [Vibrio sp.]|uniref:hypothetical protein n=1 Tax=Vibrio sp. TaxID=678 RepID=UPI00311EF0A5